MRTITAALAPALIGYAPIAAQAMPESLNCGFRDDFTARLSVKYGESQRRWGLDMDGTVLEFWASDRGTWTILRTLPTGVSYIMGAGRGALIPPTKSGTPWTGPEPKRSA